MIIKKWVLNYTYEKDNVESGNVKYITCTREREEMVCWTACNISNVGNEIILGYCSVAYP